MNLKLFINLVLYHFAVAFVVGGAFLAIVWTFNGTIPDGGIFHLGIVVGLLGWLSVFSPHFEEQDRRYVAMFTPLRLVLLFVFIQVSKPMFVDGYMLALAFFSLLTTYDIVRGRVFS